MTTSRSRARLPMLATVAFLFAVRAAGAQDATSPAPPATPTPAELCAASSRCYDAGPFLAEVANLTASHRGNFKDHVLRFNVRIRNVSDSVLILGYKGTSARVADEYGNSYFWGRAGTYDKSAQGIGTVTAREADAQFVLRPGEARMATFELVRYRPGRTAIGTTFTYDLTLVELQPLPGNQVRSVRDYSVSFQALRAGSGDAAVDAGRALLDGLRKVVRPPL